jgi:galactonate dehydratase
MAYTLHAQQGEGMTVSEVRTTVVGAPWRELTFVELETDDGLTGLAEARMVRKTDTLLACVGELGRRRVVGRDPFDVEALVQTIERLEYGRPWEVAETALALFEIACFDLMGQKLGVPVYELLGGQVRERIPAYANGWYQAERNPDEIAARAFGVVARGYRAMKLDPFGAARSELSAGERRRSVAIVAVRDAVGPDVGIMVEMHGRFTPAEAVRIGVLLEVYDIEWIEEPTLPENAAALGSIRQHVRIPIATGERLHHLPDAREFIEGGNVDILQNDLTHSGGFLNMKRLAGWANIYYRQLAPHNVCGPVGTMANIHLAASKPNVKILEHFNDFADPWVRDLVDHAPEVDAGDGCFSIPQRPGLGLTLNHEFCAAHPRTDGRMDLFRPGWERRGQ